MRELKITEIDRVKKILIDSFKAIENLKTSINDFRFVTFTVMNNDELEIKFRVGSQAVKHIVNAHNSGFEIGRLFSIKVDNLVKFLEVGEKNLTILCDGDVYKMQSGKKEVTFKDTEGLDDLDSLECGDYLGSIDGGRLSGMITKAMTSLDNKNQRFGGLQFEKANEVLSMTGCNSSRLTMAREGLGDWIPDNKIWSLSPTDCKSLKKILDSVKDSSVRIYICGEHVTFKYSNLYVISEFQVPTDDHYRDYSDYIPAKFDNLVFIDQQECVDCLKDVLKFSENQIGNFNYAGDDMEISTVNKSGCEYSDLMRIKNYDEQSGNFKIRIDYVSDAVKSFEKNDNIMLHIRDGATPVYILNHPSDWNLCHVIMPLY